MRNKKLWISLGFLAFWFVLWEVCSTLIDLRMAIPHPIPTLKYLFEMLLPIRDPSITKTFWTAIVFSTGRILIGFLLGVLFGISLFLLSQIAPWLHIGISQLMVAIKAAPVASFILVLIFLTGTDTVPSIIALLMVVPIVYQSAYDGYREMDASLSEMLTVFRVPLMRRIRIFILPELARYLAPALISAAGLAWKAGIAAEALAYTKKSIGKGLADATWLFEGEPIFAWTIAVIGLSVLLEFGLKKMKVRLMQNGTDSKKHSKEV